MEWMEIMLNPGGQSGFQTHGFGTGFSCFLFGVLFFAWFLVCMVCLVLFFWGGKLGFPAKKQEDWVF